ncbi:MAG: Copper delivery protein (cytochrome c oxidase assembly) [Nitrospirae bacterium]|nr:Copper delivery protein (cytochrome c oxidase assembly) [Nitrospirota bacterium]
MRRLLLLLFLLVAADPAPAHETTATSANISLDEKLGVVIPADISLKDENGRPVNLRSLVDRPTIIAPVYLHCSHVCPLLLTNLAETLGKLDLVQPGKDFRVVALSFDEQEGPEVAREKKPNYIAAVGRPFPTDAWPFLTGDNANIRKFTDTVGFTFQRDGEDFSHPVVVIILAPGGKVVRYLYGTTFLPFELTMAIIEAAQGRTGAPAGRVLNYCFSYDPLKKSYVFNILKVVGTVMILTVVSFFLYLVVTTKKRGSA